MTLEQVLGIVADAAEDYQRKVDQAIMQRNMDRAITALAGKEACAELTYSLKTRFGMEENIVRMTARRK